MLQVPPPEIAALHGKIGLPELGLLCRLAFGFIFNEGELCEVSKGPCVGSGEENSGSLVPCGCRLVCSRRLSVMMNRYKL